MTSVLSSSGSLQRVTAVLVTLDEESNIEDCIGSLKDAGIDRIIVVDASSVDQTAQISRDCGADVHVVEKRGLAFQRQAGLELVQTEYVLMVDADNRFQASTVNDLVAGLEKSNSIAGIAPTKVALNASGYWARCWSQHNSLFAEAPGPRNVIGTPALFRSATLMKVGYDTSITGASDDTDLCFRLNLAGWKVCVDKTECYEIVRESFVRFASKTLWYGRGDWEFFHKYPERRRSIFLHPLKGYLIKGSITAIKRGNPQVIPFYIVYTLLRSAGFIGALIERGITGRLRIYKT